MSMNDVCNLIYDIVVELRIQECFQSRSLVQFFFDFDFVSRQLTLCMRPFDFSSLLNFLYALQRHHN
jgi:hypothetical protein